MTGKYKEYEKTYLFKVSTKRDLNKHERNFIWDLKIGYFIWF